MVLKIQVLAWERHTNVAGSKQSVVSDNPISNHNTDINKR
jgi:hypothetical protein